MSRRNKDLLRILSSAVSLVVVWLITELLPVPPLVCFGLFFIVYALIGWDIVLAAIGGIGRGQILDENFLMTLATVGAFATGEHVEAVAVMLLYQIGELFQRIAVGKSRESIADLMELRPDTAHLLTQEGETDVFPEEVEIGQTIVVRPGERVPMDGVVVKGHSALDTAALTGESVPRDCHTGEEILSGVIVLNGVLEIRVEKAFYDSTVSKILDMVENASGKKARAERFITRFARYYTPVVVLLAVLLAIIPPLFDGAWKHWIQNAMNFLVVSCPCALVISVPMSFFCGIGAASREGVLVKGGDNLEQLAKADTFVFDKTGTLTRGSFAVHAVLPEENKAEILRAAAIAERGSLHPIAKSIVLEADAIEEDWLVTEMAGYGMKAEKDGRVILAGNRKLMDLNGISVREYDLIGTSVYVAKDGVCIGVIGISDRIRPDAEETVQALKQQNVKTVMLTGDRCDVAASIVRQTGVDHCEAELLPGDKVSKVEELLASRKKDGVLAYVGDGINDAPALMRADVGIAMGGIGSDAAIEAADVVLMHDSLAAIPRARSIARKTMSIVRQNIIFALGLKLAVLALSPFGLVSIWLAIFADVGVAVLAVLNAMRSGNVKIV